jgi:hypothetical protein
MARKSSGRGGSRGRSRARSSSGSKRQKVSPRGDTRFVRRTSGGQYSESDDAGRSLARDRGTRAQRTVSSGQGDRGDQALDTADEE